jgi:hypothetical protein
MPVFSTLPSPQSKIFSIIRRAETTVHPLCMLFFNLGPNSAATVATALFYAIDDCFFSTTFLKSYTVDRYDFYKIMVPFGKK